METLAFVETRQPRWTELERLLDRAEGGGIAKLALGDAQALAKLYRSASADLLWVRARGASAEVSDYLNDLVGRAYALTYPSERPRLADAWVFITRGFPAQVCREWRVFALAVLLTVAGGVFGNVGMRIDPLAAQYLMPEQHQHLDPKERAQQEASGVVAPVDQQAAFASFLFTHNIEVSFLAFALGLTAGIGTAVLLFVNGVLLGALAQRYSSQGMTGWFWAWILPHGIPELTAICLAGAAGFVLARGIVAPRGLSRRMALRREADGAVRIVLGTMLLFVVAGLIEGTISQIHPPKLSVAFKIGFAIVVGTGVYAYLLSGFARLDGSRSRNHDH